MSLNLPDRIYAQYRNKPKARAWYDITRSIGDELADAANAVALSYDIDGNSGEQLDVIGRIVVTDRNVLLDTKFTVYQCNDAGENQCGDTAVQCSPLSLVQDQGLSDEYFRVLLRAKIAKNNSDATLDGIIDACTIITPNAPWFRMSDNEDMSFSLENYNELTPIELSLLTTEGLIPKPQGVRFNGFLYGYGIVECGDDELQCGDESAECVGFIGGF